MLCFCYFDGILYHFHVQTVANAFVICLYKDGFVRFFFNKTCQTWWWWWPLMRMTLHWRHNERDDVSNHQPHDCLLNRLFRCRSKKTPKLCVTGLYAGTSPWPMTSTHKWSATREMFSFDDVIMWWLNYLVFVSLYCLWRCSYLWFFFYLIFIWKYVPLSLCIYIGMYIPTIAP